MWTEKRVQKVIHVHNPRSVLHVRVVAQGIICLSHSQLQNDVLKKVLRVMLRVVIQ